MDAKIDSCYALDDGAALHYKNGKLHTVVTFFKGANAYHVTKDGDSIHNETLKGLSLK